MSLTATARSIPGTLRQEVVIDEIRIELGGDLSDEQLRRLEKVAAACPVRRAVEAGVEFSETIRRRRPTPARRVVRAGGAS